MLFVGDYVNGIVWWTDRIGVSVDRSVISVPTSVPFLNCQHSATSTTNYQYYPLGMHIPSGLSNMSNESF
jgi:uncharacterized Ntn-hydrolase superfamily protein